MKTPYRKTFGIWVPDKRFSDCRGSVGIGPAIIGTQAAARRRSTVIDPNFSSVQLLLHCDGADASTTFTDNSSAARTVTVAGNAQIDTAQSKFGGASGLFDGTGDYITVPDAASLELGSGDFTLELFVRYANTSGNKQLIGKRSSSTVFPPFSFFTIGTTLYLYASSNGTSFDVANASAIGTVASNTWYHVAVCRSGNTIRKYLDGTKNATDITTSATLINNASGVIIGGDTGDNYHNGWIDEVRITVGFPRYTGASLTVPTEAFPNS